MYRGGKSSQRTGREGLVKRCRKKRKMETGTRGNKTKKGIMKSRGEGEGVKKNKDLTQEGIIPTSVTAPSLGRRCSWFLGSRHGNNLSNSFIVSELSLFNGKNMGRVRNRQDKSHAPKQKAPGRSFKQSIEASRRGKTDLKLRGSTRKQLDVIPAQAS